MTVPLGAATRVFKAVIADTGGAYALKASAWPNLAPGRGFTRTRGRTKAFHVLSGMLVVFEDQTVTAPPWVYVYIPHDKQLCCVR